MNDVQRLLDFLIEDKDEYIGTLKLNGKTDVIQKMVKASSVSDKIDCSETDIFMTYNTFESKKSRKTKHIRRLNACYIDIDCYNCGLSASDALTAMKKEAFGRDVPFPSATIYSGGGLYLLWKINDCNANDIDTWRRVQKKLCSLLKKYGADEKSLDASHVFRVPTSINEKHGTPAVVSIEQIAYDATYTIGSLAQWLKIGQNKSSGFSKPNQSTTTNKPNKKSRHNKTYSTPYIDYNTYSEITSVTSKKNSFRQAMGERASDIADILISRGLTVKGMREVGLFWYRAHLILSGKTYEAALQMTIDLNSKLALPLNVKEVVQATATAEKMKYVCSTEKLYKILQVDKNIEHRLKRIVSAQTRNERLRLKRSGRISSKKTEIELRRKTLVKMVDEGYSVEYICCILKISKRTYYYDKAATGRTTNKQRRRKNHHQRIKLKKTYKNENINVCVYPKSLLYDNTSTAPITRHAIKQHNITKHPMTEIKHIPKLHKEVVIC